MTVDATRAGANDTLYQPPAIEDPNASQKDEFLRLLVAQMQHQDPLDPQEGSEFVAQLATFANIEIGVETNERLAALEAGQVSDSRANLMGLVGKTMTVDATQVQLTGSGELPDLTVDLPEAATTVDIIVYDELGNEVDRIEAGPQPKGEATIGWDGLGKDGQPLPEGSYSIEVQASNAEGVLDANLSMTGMTTSVEFAADGSTMLGIGGLLVFPSAIQSVEAQ